MIATLRREARAVTVAIVADVTCAVVCGHSIDTVSSDGSGVVVVGCSEVVHRWDVGCVLCSVLCSALAVPPWPGVQRPGLAGQSEAPKKDPIR